MTDDTSMQTEIGAFDAGSGTVPVTFTVGDDVFRRPVNACRKADGSYDEVATIDRVAQVAAGVAIKMTLGVLPTRETAEAGDSLGAEDTAEADPA